MEERLEKINETLSSLKTDMAIAKLEIETMKEKFVQSSDRLWYTVLGSVILLIVRDVWIGWTNFTSSL